MTPDSPVNKFNTHKFRRHFDGKAEKWYFSVLDVVGALTESENPLAFFQKKTRREVRSIL